MTSMLLLDTGISQCTSYIGTHVTSIYRYQDILIALQTTSSFITNRDTSTFIFIIFLYWIAD